MSDQKLILPDGVEPAEEALSTDRMRERRAEDDRYVPVIIKRSDDFRRHPDDTLEAAITEGLEQIKRPTISLALSSLTAGMILGFTAMVVAIVAQGVADVDSELIRRLAVALVYPLGFVICIMSGTELFTEHTATAVFPVLAKRASPLALLRLWAIVLVGNLAGAVLSAAFLARADPVIHASRGYAILGQHLSGYAAMDIVVSGVLAGWLMAQGAWLVLSTGPNLAQIVCIYVVTFCIGLGGLHHSIAGSVEAFAAVLIPGSLTWGQALEFMSLAVVGNLIGGSVFVGALNYGHIRKTRGT